MEDKLNRMRKLIAQRDEIDTELRDLLGESEKKRRGRPPKENGDDAQMRLSPEGQ